MTTLREAAQQALEALQNCANGEDDVLLTRDALANLRAALAEPVQEPVAWMYEDTLQRKPLTREKAIALWADKSDGPSNGEIVSYCRAIERAHGIGGDK